SKRRLEELAAVDTSTLDDAKRAQHLAKQNKHRAAVEECERRGRTSIVTTNPFAALMKFPDGAGLPGHRVTAMAAGGKARFIVPLLVTADTNDYGLLHDAVDATLKMLSRIGVPQSTPLSVAADAGYCSQADLAYAAQVRGRIDILVDGSQEPENRTRLF